MAKAPGPWLARAAKLGRLDAANGFLRVLDSSAPGVDAYSVAFDRYSRPGFYNRSARKSLMRSPQSFPTVKAPLA